MRMRTKWSYTGLALPCRVDKTADSERTGEALAPVPIGYQELDERQQVKLRKDDTIDLFYV